MCTVMTIYKDPVIEGTDRILLLVDITKKAGNRAAWIILLAKHVGAGIHVVPQRIP